MLVIFNTRTLCFAASAFFPGGSRWASSRAQHRQYHCPKHSVCSQESSSEKKPVEEGDINVQPRELRGVCVQCNQIIES